MSETHDCMPGTWKDGILTVNQGREQFKVRCDRAGLDRVLTALERTDRAHLRSAELRRLVLNRARIRVRPTPA